MAKVTTITRGKFNRDRLMPKVDPPAGKRGKWIAYAGVALLHHSAEKDLDLSPAMYVDGWNGSFHDCFYHPCVIAFGGSPSQAKRRLKKALKGLQDAPKMDSAEARFLARQQVRSGD